MVSSANILPLGLVLWCFTFIRCITDAGDVESARCRVRCLAHLKHKLGAMGESHSPVTFEKCFQDTACTACLKPCGQPFISLSHCIQLCQEDEEDCEQSCRFLKHLRTTRPGVCPRPEDAEGFEAACVEGCKNDGECEGNFKCCNNGCGLTCQHPTQLYIGVPEIPRLPRIRERSKSGSVELSWKAVMMNHSAPTIPILYMVQARWNVGVHPSEHHMSEWQQVAQTTDTATVVREVGPGRWYEFRVGAVGVNGTRGFSDPTKAFKLSKEPQPPGPPQNLTEGQTMIKDSKLHVTIHWQAPKKSDLPIARYKVYWSKRLKTVTAQLMSLREYKKVVPGDILHYTLEDLDEDTTYFVQVQAISAYGDVRLKSERISTYLTTMAIQQATQKAGPPTAVVEVKALATLPALQDITPHTPFFNNGLVKANISWTNSDEFDTEKHKVLLHWLPEVCIADGTGASSLSKSMSATTHENSFIIYDLRFDCRYVVKAQLVSNDGSVGPVAYMTFTAPSCGEVDVIGDVQPDCPTNVPRVPDEPPGLVHSFLIVNTNITARISWHQPLSDAPITGYRIIWGQLLQNPNDGQPTMDQNTALTKVLTKDVLSFSIGNLQEATSYLVNLQAFSPVGSGKAASINFRTPVLQPQPIAPPYKTEIEEKPRGNTKSDISSTLAPSTRQPAIYHAAEESSQFSAAFISQSSFWTIFSASLLVALLWIPCR